MIEEKIEETRKLFETKINDMKKNLLSLNESESDSSPDSPKSSRLSISNDSPTSTITLPSSASSLGSSLGSSSKAIPVPGSLTFKSIEPEPEKLARHIFPKEYISSILAQDHLEKTVQFSTTIRESTQMIIDGYSFIVSKETTSKKNVHSFYWKCCRNGCKATCITSNTCIIFFYIKYFRIFRMVL